MQASDWIKSGGGPLLLVDGKTAPYWGGVLALKAAGDRFASDYEKACEIETYLADIEVNGAVALLLGDAPLDTCFWIDERQTIYLVRVWYCDSDFDVDTTMLQCSPELFQSPIEVLPYTARSSDFMMFDSAEPGDDPDMKVVRARLPTGRYRILTQTYAPDVQTSLVLHRFDWLGP